MQAPTYICSLHGTVLRTAQIRSSVTPGSDPPVLKNGVPDAAADRGVAAPEPRVPGWVTLSVCLSLTLETGHTSQRRERGVLGVWSHCPQ